MARPTKSAKLLTPCSQTKAETQARIEYEEKLRGSSDKIKPAKYLTGSQRIIFNAIVKSMESADVLSDLDTYLLEQTAICIDRLREIETIINTYPAQIQNGDLIRARNAYAKDFQRYSVELSLSPQSRAKIANLAMQSKQAQDDPLLRILKGGGGNAASK